MLVASLLSLPAVVVYHLHESMPRRFWSSSNYLTPVIQDMDRPLEAHHFTFTYYQQGNSLGLTGLTLQQDCYDAGTTERTTK